MAWTRARAVPIRCPGPFSRILPCDAVLPVSTTLSAGRPILIADLMRIKDAPPMDRYALTIEPRGRSRGAQAGGGGRRRA